MSNQELNTFNLHVQQVRFECVSGFLLAGYDRTVCQEDGQWSNPPPLCTGKEKEPELKAKITYISFVYINFFMAEESLSLILICKIINNQLCFTLVLAKCISRCSAYK